MLHALVPFLIFAFVVIIVAWAIIYIVDLIPGVPAPAPAIIKVIVGVIALLLILSKALPLLGVSGVL